MYSYLAALLSITVSQEFSRRYKEFEGIDIIKEHKLIQQKKSSLSKRLRDLVEERYKQIMELDND